MLAFRYRKGNIFYFFCKQMKMFFEFQVLRGGDGKAGFAVRNPAGEIVHPYQWKTNADYQDTAHQDGFYSICVDNQFSRFAGKLINLYITVIRLELLILQFNIKITIIGNSFYFRYDQWERFSKEIEDMNLSVENVTVS